MKLINSEVSFHLFKKNTTIGSSTACDIQLPDLNASNQHASIERKGSKYILTDLTSKNGTFVNGVRLSDNYNLKENDILSFGEYPLTVYKDNKKSSRKIKDEDSLTLNEKISLVRASLDLVKSISLGKISGAIRFLITLPFRAVWFALKNSFIFILSLDDDD